MTTYTKSLSNDFNFNLNPDQLVQEIEQDPGISPTCIIVLNVGDDVNITFNSPLSGAEQVILNNLIFSHTITSDTGTIINNITIPYSLVDSTTYVTVTSFNFPGTIFWPNVSNIKIISLMDEDGTSYDVKIYDVTNKKQICFKNLSNENENICDLGTLSNLPINESIFEVQAKVNGSTIAYIKNINIYHD